jgi:hypothetical protein
MIFLICVTDPIGVPKIAFYSTCFVFLIAPHMSFLMKICRHLLVYRQKVHVNLLKIAKKKLCILPFNVATETP